MKPAEISNLISLFNRAKNQTILIDKLSSKKVENLFKHNQGKNFLLNVSERDLTLGQENKYKQIVREYKLLDVDGLRELAMKNKRQYRKDKKKWEGNNKQGNGYG